MIYARAALFGLMFGLGYSAAFEIVAYVKRLRRRKRTKRGAS